jgi:hypothetical protein
MADAEGEQTLEGQAAALQAKGEWGKAADVLGQLLRVERQSGGPLPTSLLLQLAKAERQAVSTAYIF